MRLLALAGAFGLALVATSPSATPADASPFATALLRADTTAARRTAASIRSTSVSPRSRQRRHCFVAPIQTEVVNVHTPRGTRTFIRDAID